MSAKPILRIGYVPEHYLTPLHQTLRLQSTTSLPYTLTPIPFPSGTGHMITSLRSGEIDLAIGLTEGWVAGLTGRHSPSSSSSKNNGDGDGGYKIIGHWVDTPLRWAIVTGRNRDEITSVSDLKAKGKMRVGISRVGSGSHIMSFVLAQEQGWTATATSTTADGNKNGNKDNGGGILTPVVLGPFGNLREGVSSSSSSTTSTGTGTGGKEGSGAKADFFMWEHFTTKPYFEPGTGPLKKIGEIFTPWPSWMIVASTRVFPSPESDERLSGLFRVLDEGIRAFEGDSEEVVRLLGTGELGCVYSEEDAREWLKDVRFAAGGTRGVDGGVVGGVVDVLKVAGVIDEGLERGEAVERVIGIRR